MSHLKLTRTQILAHRRRAASLDERLPRGKRALRQAAWAGLQDSMPRAALLSIHARMNGTKPADWEDSSLVQIWGPRYNAYVVAQRDLALFTLGRLPEDGGARARAEDLAERLRSALGKKRMVQSAAARAIAANHPNAVRYAAPTGTVLIRWDGARQPDLWIAPAPNVEPRKARAEFAKRFLHVFGPASADSFAEWAGVKPRPAHDTFDALRRSLTAVRTPLGEAWILSADEPSFRSAPGPPAPARLLPSGDTWFLWQGADRELLVPDASRRSELWTSRVWPGALLVEGETAGTWRRAGNLLTVRPWRRLSVRQRAAVEAEAASFPLPGLDAPVEVRWDEG
ncbi:MAG: crosslink repair DNA glycosylase YcaQ family protein [bacterium]